MKTATACIAAILLLAAPLVAQNGYGSGYDQGAMPSSSGSSYAVTPYPNELSSGANASAEQEAPSGSASSEQGEALPPTGYPYNLQTLATRHFDFIVAPTTVLRGSMEDTSISLGEFARQLRAEKREASQPAPPQPGAMAAPAEPR